MPRRNGSYFGLTVNPTPSVASGIWRVREAEEFLRVNKWPATPGVPGSPVGIAGNAQVSLTWSAPTLGSPPTDYQVQYSSNSGSTWTTFADGTSTATSAVVTGLTNGTGYIFRVRAVNALGEGPYGSASGVVTPVALDVALLLHFDGTNGSTTFTDSSGNGVAVTANGNAQISTAQSKFGGASGYFDGSGDSISFEDLQLGTGDFTVEMWFKTTSTNQYAQLIGNEGFSEFYFGWTLLINNDGFGGGQIAVYRDGGFVVASSSGDWSDDAWHHIALVRSGSTVTLYIDGAVYGTATDTGSWNGDAYFVGRNNQFFGRDLIGYIDELRIVKGTAVYTANFTPPTAPF
jgi:hypothetical protein